MWAKSKQLLSKEESIISKFPTNIFLMNNICMTCIFSKEVIVTSRGICPGGGSHFPLSKYNYGSSLRQNL